MELVIVAFILFAVIMGAWLVLPGSTETFIAEREIESVGHMGVEQLA